MSNLAALLRNEITRLSRREHRKATDAIKKTSVQHRSDIAAIKRRLASIEKYLRQLDKMVSRTAPAASAPNSAGRTRYSAKGLAAQRRRLELTAAEVGLLLNVSLQTIYNWESGKTRPSPAQMPGIVALRSLSKRTARAILSQRGQ